MRIRIRKIAKYKINGTLNVDVDKCQGTTQG